MEVTTTTTQTLVQTPPYLVTMTMTTSLPSPANKPHRCSNQASSRARLPPWHRGDLGLEAIFDDHGVCSEIIADSLALERANYEQIMSRAPCGGHLHQPHSWPTDEKMFAS